MAVITGIRGLLNGVALFRDWSVNETANLIELGHAGVAEGGRQRRSGLSAWTATYNSYGLVPDYWPGESVTFTGSIDGSVGVTGAGLVTEVTINYPIGSDDPPSHSATIQSDGALTRGAAVVGDPTPEIPVSVRGICPRLSPVDVDAASYTAQPNVYNITITLSIDVAEYADCSANGIQQVKETLWDASISYDQYVDGFDDLTNTGAANDVGTPFYVIIGIDSDTPPTEYYEFQWMRSGEFSNMAVNRETGELVSATVNLEMSALEEVGSSAPTVTQGQVIKPDTTVWRPDASAPYTMRRLTLLREAADNLAKLAADGRVPPRAAVEASQRLQQVEAGLKARNIDLEGMMKKHRAQQKVRKDALEARKKASAMRKEVEKHVPVREQPKPQPKTVEKKEPK